MKNEIVDPLVKNSITKIENKNTSTSSECCGGEPTRNADACCKLDEEKKAEGETGCGCNTSEKKDVKISCC